jgi:hypothetical protein
MLSEFLSPVVQGSGWDAGNDAVTIFYGPICGIQSAPTGKIVSIAWIIGDASNVITMTGTILDPYGNSLHSKSAMAKNGTTIENTLTDYVTIYPGCQIQFTPSGASGATVITGQVRISVNNMRS